MKEAGKLKHLLKAFFPSLQSIIFLLVSDVTFAPDLVQCHSAALHSGLRPDSLDQSWSLVGRLQQIYKV